MTIPHLGLHPSNEVLDDVGRRPVASTTADVMHEALQDALALRGVRDFRVELQTVVATRRVGDGGHRHVIGGGDAGEAVRQLGDLVAVAHPDIEQRRSVIVDGVVDIPQQRGFADLPHPGVAEFLHRAGRYLATEFGSHGLHAVADAEDGHAQTPDRLASAGSIVRGHGLRTAGENDAARGKGANVLGRCIPGVQFAIHPGFTDASRDQLGVLGAEIQDEDSVGVDIGHFRPCEVVLRLRVVHRGATRRGSWALP